jgi:N-acetyl-alpha-D-muramate 1-phosphate uridylyltransferase
LDCDYQAIARAFLDSRKRGLMTVFRNNGLWERSNVKLKDQEIIAYDKRSPDDSFHHVDYGLGALHSEALASYDVHRQLDLADIYRDLVAQRQLAAFEVSNRFYEIGSFSGLEETRALLERRHQT